MKDTADQEPCNIEAEQQVLGAILGNNDLLHRVSDILRPEHFYEPIHAEIYERAVARISREHIASPVTLKADFETHEGLADLGGAKYLVRLVGFAISSFAIRDYAVTVIDAWQRRRLLEALRASQSAILGGEGVQVACGGVEAVLASLIDAEGKPSSESFLKAMTGAIAEMDAAYKGEGAGVSTGLKDLDRMIGNLVGGDMVILGGAPSMGKTSLAAAIANNMAKAGQGVVIVSLEMTSASLAHRILSAETSVPYAKMRTGGMSETEFRRILTKARDMETLPIEIVLPHVREMGAIYGAVKRAQADLKAKGYPLAMVMLDYLQLVRARGKGRYEQVTEISMQTKGMAMQLSVPVVALSQLSRDVVRRDNKRPNMSDLRESGQLEQDADSILFCHREAYYLIREGAPMQKDGSVKEADRADWEASVSAQKNVMEVIVAKNRNGAIGTVRLGFHEATNRVWNQGEDGGSNDFG